MGRVAPPPRVALCARHRAPPCAACVQRGTEHCCQRAHEGHRKRAWRRKRCRRGCGPQPAGAGSMAAAQAARGSPSARKRPRAQSPSPARVT